MRGNLYKNNIYIFDKLINIKLLSKKEEAEIDSIKNKLIEIKKILNTDSLDVSKCYNELLKVKSVLGNYNNLISFLACIKAKEYFKSEGFIDESHEIVADKKQGANGLDFDFLSLKKDRIIGELKTTVPYKKHNFGAKQKESIAQDLKKLINSEAKFKFYFVTNDITFELISKLMLEKNLNNIKLINLMNINS